MCCRQRAAPCAADPPRPAATERDRFDALDRRDVTFSDIELTTTPLDVGGDFACVEWTARMTPTGAIELGNGTSVDATGERVVVNGARSRRSPGNASARCAGTGTNSRCSNSWRCVRPKTAERARQKVRGSAGGQRLARRRCGPGAERRPGHSGRVDTEIEGQSSQLHQRGPDGAPIRARAMEGLRSKPHN